MNWIPASFDSLTYYPTPALLVSSQQAPPRYLLGKFFQKNFVNRRSNVLSFALAQEIRAWADGHPELSRSAQAYRLACIYRGNVSEEAIRDLLRNRSWSTETAPADGESPAVPIWLLMLPAKFRLVLLFVLMLNRGDPC